jgi:hypothetical protein
MMSAVAASDTPDNIVDPKTRTTVAATARKATPTERMTVRMLILPK